MAINSALARVGVTGAAFRAPLGSTFPTITTALTAPTSPFVDLGAISDEGLTETRNQERTTFTPWQATSSFRTVTTSEEKTFTAIFWESRKETVAMYYGVAVADMEETATDSGIITFDEADRTAPDAACWIFDIFDGDNQRRFECPRAEATPNGDIVYAPGNIIGYPLLITAYPVAGVSIRRYFSEGWDLS